MKRKVIILFLCISILIIGGIITFLLIKKQRNIIIINEVIADYTGNSVSIKNTNDILLTYYSDSNCTIKTTNDNAKEIGGEPINVGIYYVIATNKNGNKSSYTFPFFYN